MHKAILAAAISIMAATPSLATDFKNTTGTAEEYLSQAREMLSRKELTTKLTRLRDIGGYTPTPATACVSFDKYDQHLRASSGNANFYPTPEECWKTEPNQKIKSTGSCSSAISTNFLNPDLSTPILVCEFETDSWFSKNIWLNVADAIPQ